VAGFDLPGDIAGNLENEHADKILTFGYAPHASPSEYRPISLEDWYRWRVEYFNSAEIQHMIHKHFARIC